MPVQSYYLLLNFSFKYSMILFLRFLVVLGFRLENSNPNSLGLFHQQYYLNCNIGDIPVIYMRQIHQQTMNHFKVKLSSI
jgi:hypothetical protein